jgi:hypothetical protein
MFSSSLLFVGLVPLSGDIFLPVRVLGNLIDTVLDNSESLSDLVVLHIFFVVQLVGEFKQLIDLSFLVIFDLLSSLCPRGFLSFLALLAGNRGLLLAGTGEHIQVLGRHRLRLGVHLDVFFRRLHLVVHLPVLVTNFVVLETLYLLSLFSGLLLE